MLPLVGRLTGALRSDRVLRRKPATVDMTLESILLDDGNLDAPKLCGFLHHGWVAKTLTELSRSQNAHRLWQQTKDCVPSSWRIRDAFVGHGDFRPVLELFKDALAAGALTAPVEQAAVGVTQETNSECLRELQAGLAQALKRLDETGSTLNTVQSDVRTLQTDLGVLQLSAIPESHRLYVCGFADQHFNIETDFPQLTRLEVLGIYGSLICRSLGRQGLRNSVAKEPRGDGSFRNVYDDRVHLSTFEDCRALLPAAVAEEVARRSIRLSPGPADPRPASGAFSRHPRQQESEALGGRYGPGSRACASQSPQKRLVHLQTPLPGRHERGRESWARCRHSRGCISCFHRGLRAV